MLYYSKRQGYCYTIRGSGLKIKRAKAGAVPVNGTQRVKNGAYDTKRKRKAGILG